MCEGKHANCNCSPEERFKALRPSQKLEFLKSYAKGIVQNPVAGGQVRIETSLPLRDEDGHSISALEAATAYEGRPKGEDTATPLLSVEAQALEHFRNEPFSYHCEECGAIILSRGKVTSHFDATKGVTHTRFSKVR